MHSSIKNGEELFCLQSKLTVWKGRCDDPVTNIQTIIIPTLLQFKLFGKDFEKVRDYVVMQSKKRVLLHLPSSAAAKIIFTVVDLCGFELELQNNTTVTCCGKVTI